MIISHLVRSYLDISKARHRGVYSRKEMKAVSYFIGIAGRSKELEKGGSIKQVFDFLLSCL